MIIIVWGKPTNYSDCTKIEELENGKDCIDYCEDNDDCIVAHMTSSDCYNCEGELVVQSLTSSENKRIAFKTNSSTTCSDTEFIDYYYNDYTMKYQNDGYWNVIKNEVPWECESDWEIFEREMGFWCVKLFYSEDKIKLTNSTSNQFCESNNSTLSALENLNMTNWVQETAWSYSDGSTLQYILTDGLISLFCCENWDVQQENCGFPEPYSWYDEMFVNTSSGYNWETFVVEEIGYPYAYMGDEQCIFLMSQKGDEHDGQTLLKRCDTEISMILCGKKATPI